MAVVGLTVTVLGLAVFVYLGGRSRPTPTGGTFYPKASLAPTTSTSSTPPPPTTAALPTGTKPLPVSTQPATSTSGSLTITAPTSGSTVTDGTMVTGRAQVAGGKVSFRLKGSNSGQLASGTIQVTGDATQNSPFSFALGLTNQVCDSTKKCGTGAVDTGVLEVYSISPKDGSEINQASIPVAIKG